MSSLFGRESECAHLDSLLRALHRAESRALVLHGEAGIGKTALLEYLLDSATDLTVLRAVGVKTEMELPYAGLHQLCASRLDRLNELTGPQREALEIAFGVSTRVAPDRFLVGLGFLSLLSEAAEERPLLCIIDDAQWLDRPSALTLAFVARRLSTDRIGLVFATREVGSELAGVPDLEVTGLRDGAARALLASTLQFLLDEPVRERIIAETRGNPLALIELPRGLTATQHGGGLGGERGDVLSSEIEKCVARRLEGLHTEAQRLLLVAAAEPVGDPLLVWRAAERLAIPFASASEILTEDWITIDERVRFRHPLVRSAVYAAATPRERHAAHLALAEVIDRDADPDRRAWHLAAAASGPDEAVALELEHSADRARTRGGLAASAAFLDRAVTLTAEPARRAPRAIIAAAANLHAGAFPEAARLLSTAQAGPLDKFQQAQVDRLKGQIAFASTMGGEAPQLLLSAAQRLEELDANLARETYLDAWAAALFAGRTAAGVDLAEVSRAGRSFSAGRGLCAPSACLLDALSRLVIDGPTTAGMRLRGASRAFAEGGHQQTESFRWGWMTTIPATMLWEEENWSAAAAHRVSEARDVGALGQLPLNLTASAVLSVWRGEFGDAEAAIAEAEAVTEATGTHHVPYGASLLAGWRGREPHATALIKSTVHAAMAAGQGIGVQWAEWVSATLLNARGEHDRALVAAQSASDDTPHLCISTWALVELIEAAVRCGEPFPAAEALERLTETTRISENDWGLGIESRCRALIGRGADAEERYRESLERLARTRLRPEFARAHLLYGEWLRRENRRRDARTELRAAHDLFASIGMDSFADRARRELAAAGEKVRLRMTDPTDALTAQERQIAGLAQAGFSNPEIGARLFLSPRTVEWHLRKVFTKLGISSRRELSAVLPSAPEPTLVTGH